MGRLAGKVALITGAARGQGEAEARRFVAEGAKVAITDIRDQQGAALATELGDAAAYWRLDVTDPAAWDEVVAATVARWGRLDVLVNNAGIGNFGSLEDLPLEAHRQLVDINLNGVYYGMRAVKAAMAAGGGGAIVNISSIDGLAGVLGMTSYSATKFAVTGMTKSGALELGPHGIRVNSIHPGIISSPMLDAPPPEDEAGQERHRRTMERLNQVISMQPIARMGTPDEVANLALFLASDEASYISGAQVLIDGGHLAGPWRPPLGS